MNDLLFFGSITAFFLGVFVATLLPVGLLLGVFLLFVGGALFLYRFLFLSYETRGIFYIALFLFAIGVGVIRFSFALEVPLATLEVAVPAEVKIIGVIESEPERGSDHTEFFVLLEGLQFTANNVSEIREETLERHRVRALVFASPYKKFAYGEKISLRGTLRRPENFETTNGREFDYIHYLGKDDVRYLLYYPKIKHISYGNGLWLKGKLFDLKQAFLSRIARLIPEPEASLAGGLLVGTKQSLGEQWLQKFRETGVIHIVVLSGYNITLISYFIMAFFTRLRFSPKFVAIFGGVGILLFMILVGAGATVVRASLMGILVLVARTMGQTSNMLRFLFLVGAMMVFWNPEILVYSASFQLSFLATFGLLIFGGFLYDKLTWIPERFLIREILTATLSTQIFVLPMILYIAGQFSFVSIPTNVLVLLAVPFAMFFAFFAGVFGFVSSLLALPVAYIAYLFLAFIFLVVDVFASLPFASTFVPAFDFWVVPVVYLFYGGVYLGYRYRSDIQHAFFRLVYFFERKYERK